ncbi:MAG TPA: M64 family metallopeptidase [Saprospiraceae bacterium]|nr:M64 family metallopeptidase [Saprospiraceae bacterium]HPN69361.1 M64 family metallopeptidase [Saprospiraceae bacterium]
MNNGSDDKRINFVLMGDGYQSSEMKKYKDDANALSNYFFTKSPFKEYRNFFNFHIIEVPSKDSGADHPGNASDEGSNPPPIKMVDTYLGSTFDYAGIHRLLVPTSPNIINVLASNFPDYDQALVLVNSNIYGGSGGWLATASTDLSSSEVMIHEVGHSFANLGDEYWFNCDERPNRTAIKEPTSIRWKNWLINSDIGIHNMEGNNCYRPHNDCEMRYLNREFCSVCKEAIVNQIYRLVSPIESSLPKANIITFANDPMEFTLNLILPQPNTLKIEWKLDETLISTKNAKFTLDRSVISKEKHTLTAIVTDTTNLSRTHLTGEKGLSFQRSWTINSESPVGTIPTENFSYNVYPNPAYDELNVAVFTKGKLNYTIINSTGQVLKNDVISENASEKSFQIDINDIPKGWYQLSLKTDQYHKNVGFIKM